MIELTGGHVQGANGAFIVPNGYIELYLSSDATVVASPHGVVLGGTTNAILFGFDDQCDIVEPAYLWSNAELNPQTLSPPSLGTYYIVNFYDDNGTRLNNKPQQWVFGQAAGSTVDVSGMVPVTGPGGVVYYPSPGTVTSIGLVVPVWQTVSGSPITTSGAFTITDNVQDAGYVFAGPASGSPASPAFRQLVAADIPTTAQVYNIGMFIQAQYASSQVLLLVQLERAVSFGANMAPSTATIGTNPTAQNVWVLNQNGSQFATLTLNTDGTIAFSGTANFSAGDILSVVGTASPDETLANVGVILSGVY